MSAGTYDTVLEVGATWTRVLTWLDSAGAPVNLTGYSAKMQLRERPGATVVLELSTTNSRITLGTTNGVITLLVGATDTAALAAVIVHYDLELTSPGGVVTRLLEGTITIRPEITA